jgi:hypothetical protein
MNETTQAWERRPETRWRRIGEFAVVAASISLMFLCLWPAVRDIEKPDGPLGEMIPRDPPDQARRVQIAPDFSMVLPRNWVVNQTGLPDGMRAFIHPRAWHRRPATLLIVDNEAPPDLKAMKATKFQGAPAFERMHVVRHDTFDDPPWSEYELRFDRGGRWWSVTYGFKRETTELPPVIRQYIETLRWDEAAESPAR